MDAAPVLEGALLVFVPTLPSPDRPVLACNEERLRGSESLDCSCKRLPYDLKVVVLGHYWW